MKGKKFYSPEIVALSLLAFSSSAIFLYDKQYLLATLLFIFSTLGTFYVNGDAKGLSVIVLPLIVTSSICIIKTALCPVTFLRESAKYHSLLVFMSITGFLQFFPNIERMSLNLLTVAWIIESVLSFVCSRRILFDAESLLWTSYLVLATSISRFILCRLLLKSAQNQTNESIHLQTLQSEAVFLCNIAPLVFLPLDQLLRRCDSVVLGVMIASVSFLFIFFSEQWNFLTSIAQAAANLSPLVSVELLYLILPYAVHSLKAHMHAHLISYLLLSNVLGLSIIYLLCLCIGGSTEFQSIPTCKPFQTCSTQETGKSWKRVVTLRRKIFHFILIVFIIILQREEKFHFDFERFVFPLGITVCLLFEIYLCACVNKQKIYQRLRSCIAKPDEVSLVRSHLYLLLGSILPSLLLKLPSVNEITEFDCLSFKGHVLGRLFSFSGFVCVGVTDAFAAVAGIVFGHTYLGRMESTTSKISSKTWEGIFAAYVSTFSVLLYAYLALSLTLPNHQSLFTGRDFLDFINFLHVLSFSCACFESILEIDDNIALPIVMVILWSICQRTFLAMDTSGS